LNKKRWALVQSEMKYVQVCAKKIARSLPVSIQIADLASIGLMGLIAAAQRFDPTKGIAFGAYARHRVRGAMLDSLRRGNYAYELHDQLYDDNNEEHSERNQEKPNIVAVDPRPLPDEIAEMAVLAGHLHGALGTLNEQERFAILAKADGRTLAEIGARFGHRESWAFTVLHSARHKMKRSLALHRLDDAA